MQDPAVQAQRAAWRQRTARVDARRFWFLDPSGARTDLTRAYGRAPRGERVVGYVPRRHWQATTRLTALAHDGTTVPLVYAGGTDVPLMRAYVEQQLAAVLRPGDIVALDRLAAHKSPRVVAAIEAAGAEVWLLPPYSPDFNPVELLWAKVKAYLRQAFRDVAQVARPLWQLIGEALRTITPEDAAGWFAHCGYRITQT